MTEDKKFQKLSLDKPENTKIMCGHISMTVQQMEDEIAADSEIGKKLKEVEELLKNY